MNIFQEIQQQVHKAFPALFGSEVELNKITINEESSALLIHLERKVSPDETGNE